MSQVCTEKKGLHGDRGQLMSQAAQDLSLVSLYFTEHPPSSDSGSGLKRVRQSDVQLQEIRVTFSIVN